MFENLGSCLYDQELYKGAITFYEKALDIYDQNSSNAASQNALSKIGDCYFRQANYEKSEAIYQSLSQNRDALHFYKLGRVAQKKEEWGNAMQLFEQALELLASARNTEFEIMIHLAQASTLEAIGNWKEAWEAYLLVQQLAKQRGSELRDVQSRVYLNDDFSALFDGLVKTAYELGQVEPDYLEQALSYSEQSKADVLKRLIQTEEILTDSLRKEKQHLQTALESVDKIIFEETTQGSLANQTKLNDAYTERYKLKMKLNEFYEAEKLEATPAKIDLATIQSSLSPKQSLVNYHVTAQSIFIFHLTQTGFRVLEIPKPRNFEDQLLQFYNSIRTRPDVLPNPDAAYAIYTRLAYEFYELLIQPIEDELNESVLLIPDKLLAHLPFEVLLSELPIASNLFKKHPYLLHQYSFHYSYSIGLWSEMKARISNTNQVNALTIAPDFADHELPTLAYNIPEAKSIRQLTGSEVLLGKAAQEHRFKEILQNFNVIHFSTHGEVNNTSPAFSYLAFANPTDLVQDGRLYASEINNLNLSADMVFLSACQTNIGKYFKGEGLMSLARAFTFAGAKSIVASLWSIDDMQTKYIVEQTYQSLKDGQPKHLALQTAKQHFLANAQQIHAHPYYWSGLILIGDEVSLNIKKPPSVIWMILIGLFILTTIGVIRRVLG